MDALERFVAGDLEAFESLFRQHQGEVYRWIVRIVRDPAAAEDLTLEAFWRLYNARTRLDPVRSCRAWLRRVATNLAIDHWRGRRRTETETLATEPAANPRGDCIEQEQKRNVIYKAVAELSPPLRIVVQLGLIEEEPYSDIAEALGISLGAVKLRMFRATRILRRKLEEIGVKP